MTKDEWKDKLTPEQYSVMRNKGTEAPFSGKFVKHNEQGVYMCSACGNPLFKSEAKYDSKTPGLIGWPSFSEVIDSGSVELKEDNSMFMHRTEVVCKKCGSHLGHVFDADDSPNGTHYCVNSVALDFKPKK